MAADINKVHFLVFSLSLRYDTKYLREDSYGNMFVLRCTEVEVRSPREALEVFHKGQKRRRVAQTQLNHEANQGWTLSPKVADFPDSKGSP